MQKKSLQTILYSTAGVVVMLVILIAFNFVAGAARKRLDLTQEKAYTLSAGTRAILKKLDTPVTIRFYCTQSEAATPETVYLKGYARKVEAADGVVRCERSMDDMLETVEAPLPAAVTVVSEINEPRIPGLMQIMKAKSKPMRVWSLADLGVEAPAPVREVVSNLAEEQDRKHILFEGTVAEQADAFVGALIREGVLGR